MPNHFHLLKADPDKLRIARRLRGETTVTLQWIARGIADGHVDVSVEQPLKNNPETNRTMNLVSMLRTDPFSALAGVVISALILCSCGEPISGVFQLRTNSPLPAFVSSITNGVNATLSKVRIYHYEATTSPKWKVKFVLEDNNGRTLLEKTGTGNWHPDSLAQGTPAMRRPNWVIIEVDGTRDVYEQSESNNLLIIVKK